jgi:hypothetical protein
MFVRPAVGEFALVDRAVRAALAGGAVVGRVDDDGVVELARLLEVVDDATDLVIGVLAEAGIDLDHAAEQPLLVVRQRLPGTHRVARCERPLGHRVDRAQLRALQQDAALDHAR